MMPTAAELRQAFATMHDFTLHRLQLEEVADWNRDLLAKLKALQPAWRASRRRYGEIDELTRVTLRP